MIANAQRCPSGHLVREQGVSPGKTAGFEKKKTRQAFGRGISIPIVNTATQKPSRKRRELEKRYSTFAGGRGI